MNSTPPAAGQLSDLKGDTPEGKVYEYRLSLLSNLLNPPEVLLYRCACVFSLLVSMGLILKGPSNPVGWIMLIVLSAVSWQFLFRHGLPLYSNGKLVSLVITDELVALETNGKFFHAPRNQVTVRRGLAGTYIISRPHGDCLLVNKDAIGFDQLKAEITAPSSVEMRSN
jgi:hypothetical protein